ncbi:MAG: hypothetical protein HN337_05115 [Deltaproteobacteria bacterium]|nr:hypothetical protein [Deltaproteobacteria bacterium]
MKRLVMAGVLVTILALSGSAIAEEKKGPSWTFQVGYSPAVAGGFFADDDGGDAAGAGTFFPIGGALSVDWRSKGRWGVHVPISFNLSPINGQYVPIIGVGVNAAFHFRKRDKKFDPYLLMGGKAYIAAHNSHDVKGVVIPMPSLGIGTRGYLSKNVGLYGEMSAQGIPFFGGAIGTIQGVFGVSIKF